MKVTVNKPFIQVTFILSLSQYKCQIFILYKYKYTVQIFAICHLRSCKRTKEAPAARGFLNTHVLQCCRCSRNIA